MTDSLTHEKAVSINFNFKKGTKPMSKPEWGVKRVCFNCNTRFYDLQKHPITCPKCETVYDPDAHVKKRRGRPPATETKFVPIPPELVENLDLELGEDLEPIGDSDDVLEDTSDFGEDEDVGIEKVVDED